MFKSGCGWLGWTPDVVLHTPMPMLELALEGLIEFRRMLAGVPEELKPEDVATLPGDDIGNFLRRRARG